MEADFCPKPKGVGYNNNMRTKTTIKTLTLTLLLSACGANNSAIGSEDFKELAAEYVAAAAAEGFDVKPVPAFLTGDFTDRTHVRLGALTRCVYQVDDNGQANVIEFFADNWSKLSPGQKRKAYFHMQGHCGFDLDGVTGIMRGNVQGEGEIQTNWSAWLAEFFNQLAVVF